MRANVFSDRSFWWFVKALMFAYILARAVFVPMVHDVARMFRFYIDTGVIFPPNAMLDAGNHLLVSLVAYCSTLIFGRSLIVVRLFVVLNYLLIAGAVIGLLHSVEKRLIRVCCGLALLTMPFLSDHFALFRGYGPAIAFEMLGVLFLIRFVLAQDRRSLLMMIGAIVFASFACLSVLLLSCIMLGIAFGVMLLRRKDRGTNLLLLVVFGAITIAFLSYFGVLLHENGSLYFGGTNGLVLDIAGTMGRSVLNNYYYWLPFFIAAVGATVICWAFIYFFLKRNDVLRVPLFILGMILFLLCIGAVLMHGLLDTPYPIDRTALHYYPVFIVLVAVGLDRLSTIVPNVALGTLVLLVFPVHAVMSLNLDHTKYWADQSILPEVFDLINAERLQGQRPFVISADILIWEVWGLGRRFRGDRPMSLHIQQRPQLTCDLMITDVHRWYIPSGFHKIHVSQTDRSDVWKRDIPLQQRIIFDTTFSEPRSRKEHVEFWRLRSYRDSLADAYFVQIDLVGKSDTIVTQGSITYAHPKNTDDQFFDRVELNAMQPEWHADTLRLIRRMLNWKGDALVGAVFLHNAEDVCSSCHT